MTRSDSQDMPEYALTGYRTTLPAPHHLASPTPAPTGYSPPAWTNTPFHAAIQEYNRAAWRLQDVSELKLSCQGGGVTTGVLSECANTAGPVHHVQTKEEPRQEHPIDAQLQKREPANQGI